MSDEAKTKDQLRAEIEALTQRLEELESRQTDSITGKRATEGASAPVLSTPITRRGAITSWVAPVILSVPAVQTASMLATVFKPGVAQAATRVPTPMVKKGTPTMIPTPAGRCLPVPTVAPTLGMASAPDCRPNHIGLVALGSARALSGSKLARASRSVPPCQSLQA